MLVSHVLSWGCTSNELYFSSSEMVHFRLSHDLSVYTSGRSVLYVCVRGCKVTYGGCKLNRLWELCGGLSKKYDG